MIDGRTEEKEVEIIAEKSRKTAYIFLALATLGVAVAAAGVILLVSYGFAGVMISLKIVELVLTVVGALMLLIFGGLYVKRLFRPYALITLEDGGLKLPDGKVCNPNEISSVEKDKRKIILTVNGGKIEINGVANFEKAYRKLCVLTGSPVSE